MDRSGGSKERSGAETMRCVRRLIWRRSPEIRPVRDLRSFWSGWAAVDLEAITRDPPCPGLEEFLVRLGQIRTEQEAIGLGRYRELLLTNRQYAFARILDQTAVITAVNNDENPAQVWIRLPFEADEITDLMTGEKITPQSGQLNVTLDACGCGLYRIG